MFIKKQTKFYFKLFVIFLLCHLVTSAFAITNEELAREIHNPLSKLINFPIQYNSNFNSSPYDERQQVAYLQPVIPFKLNNDLMLVTRTVLPLISQPRILPNGQRKEGLGDTTFATFFAPANQGDFVWGLGPIFLLPTGTEKEFTANKWGAGPALAAINMVGQWTYGALLENVWSFAGEGSRDTVNYMLFEPFFTYDLPKSWYIISSPIITSNWEAKKKYDQWVVPLGIGVGKFFRFYNQPLTLQLSYYENVKKPIFDKKKSIRLQIQFFFPED